MKISDVLRQEDVLPDLLATTKDEVLAELATKLVERHRSLELDEVLRIIHERERLGSTGIGDGIAIPHGKVRKMEGLALAVGRSRQGIDFNSLDGRPAYLFFLLVAPQEAAGVHLKMLARISRILKDPEVRTGLMAAADAAAIHTLIQQRDRLY